MRMVTMCMSFIYVVAFKINFKMRGPLQKIMYVISNFQDFEQNFKIFVNDFNNPHKNNRIVWGLMLSDMISIQKNTEKITNFQDFGLIGYNSGGIFQDFIEILKSLHKISVRVEGPSV